MDDWRKHNWNLDLSGLRDTLPSVLPAQILAALITALLVIGIAAAIRG